jgi:hypothetical protein
MSIWVVGFQLGRQKFRKPAKAIFSKVHKAVALPINEFTPEFCTKIQVTKRRTCDVRLDGKNSQGKFERWWNQ